jgi:hypothetical protein
LAWGTPVVATLRDLSPEDLDREQSDRIRNILQRLKPPVDDTPSSLASLLVNDPAYWSAIAHELSHDQLRLANQHLERFGAQPIVVSSDPQERIATARD